MRWMTRFGARLVSVLGNEGAVRNVKSDIDGRTAVMAYLELLAVRLALVDPNPTTLTTEAA